MSLTLECLSIYVEIDIKLVFLVFILNTSGRLLLDEAVITIISRLVFCLHKRLLRVVFLGKRESPYSYSIPKLWLKWGAEAREEGLVEIPQGSAMWRLLRRND